MTNRIAMTAILFFAGVPVLLAAPNKCGLERWSVKTLADSQGAKAAKSQPKPITISELVKLQAPTRKDLVAARAKRFPQELQTYTVKALVIGYKQETDQDFHIVLADPDNPKVTMIAEIPAGACVPPVRAKFFAGMQQGFASAFSRPPAGKLHTLPKPVPATFTGVFFFDYIHGQDGVSENGAELHPVLSFTKGSAQ